MCVDLILGEKKITLNHCIKEGRNKVRGLLQSSDYDYTDQHIWSLLLLSEIDYPYLQDVQTT